MDFVVKNTTKNGWLDVVCPYFCMGCGRLGRVICGCCKNDIKVSCGLEKGWLEGLDGRGDLDGFWAVGERKGLLEELVKGYKYAPVRGAGVILAELLAEVIPCSLEECLETGEGHLEGAEGYLGVLEGVAGEKCPERALVGARSDLGVGGGYEGGMELEGEGGDARGVLRGDREVVVVPLPTVRRHIRERGFDHTLVMARKLAKLRGWRCERVLARANKAVQVGASAEQRLEQAKTAYRVAGKMRTGVDYLLVDDVWTTGASMGAAARVMREAGAEGVYGAVVAVGR